MQDLQESLDHLDVNARREDKTMDKNCVHTRDTGTNNDIMRLKKIVLVLHLPALIFSEDIVLVTLTLYVDSSIPQRKKIGFMKREK